MNQSGQPENRPDDAIVRQMFEQAVIALLIVNCPDGRIVEANAMAEDLLQCRKDQLRQFTLYDLTAPYDRDILGQSLTPEAGRDSSQLVETTLIRPDQTSLGVSLSLSMFSAAGESFFRCAVETVGKESADSLRWARKYREKHEQVVQLEKMASLGSLIAGVAHEINTPLGALRSNTDLFIRSARKLRESLAGASLSNQDELLALLDQIDEVGKISDTAAERIVTIVNSLRTFARFDRTEMESADIHQGIDSTLTLVGHELKNRVEVIKEYGDIPAIKCFPNKLNQVFMNLLVNASHAIGDHGTIRIQTSQVDSNHISIVFSDSGSGIAPEHMSRIFQPGFTTKGSGVGTGLGLAIVHHIIEEHLGRIDVESKVGEGTTFTITLPIRYEI